jgi:hypothetical protein
MDPALSSDHPRSSLTPPAPTLADVVSQSPPEQQRVTRRPTPLPDRPRSVMRASRPRFAPAPPELRGRILCSLFRCSQRDDGGAQEGHRAYGNGPVHLVIPHSAPP